ncbi:sensor histidine kinase [Austwickia sp. TVS 96-490-7B]|uniref:sensor histidine kinase n=1 Tax=Austwickia sp. TVS 96-490-7B TaxID=2830843 RepID=UPI001C58931A|nr:sensor histidine kinase [Austwickia sp. TVS 96-490-7B]
MNQAAGRTRQVIAAVAALDHIVTATLLTVAVIQSWRTHTPALPLLLAAAAFTSWYVGGPRRGSTTWFVILAGLWGALTVVSPAFVWVAFGLWLHAARLLPLATAATYTATTLAVVLLIPAIDSGSWTVSKIVGPSVGALVAVALARGQVLLARESLTRAQLLESLLQAQEESAVLHDQLAAAHRHAGALAERTRLSRDIHDTLAQGFSSIVLLARSADSAPDDAARRDLLARIEATAVDNLHEARRVVGALTPTALEHHSLTAALQRLLDDLHRDTGITTELRVSDDPPQLRTTDEVVLLRTVQGALANVRTHAHAHQVIISVDSTAHEVLLDIVDDGIGFDPSRHDRPPDVAGIDVTRGGYGLTSTRARLKELGGMLTIESAPGHGTAVCAHLPLRPPASDDPPEERT